MNRAIFLLIITVVAGCSAPSMKESGFSAKVTSFGLWKQLDQISPQDRESILESSNGLGLLSSTKEIPMEIGNIFIFHYDVVGKDGVYKTEMVQWYPELVDGNIVSVKKTQASEFTIENGKFSGFWGHGLFEKSQLVPGEWGYEVHQNGEVLVSFKFQVR